MKIRKKLPPGELYKYVFLLLLVAILPACAIEEVISLGQYEVSFDMRIENLDLKETGPVESETLAGNSYAQYALVVNNIYNNTAAIRLTGYSYPEASDEKTIVEEALKGQDCTEISTASRTMDGHMGVIGEGFSVKSSQKIYAAAWKMNNDSLEICILSDFPWDEGTRQLINTVHIKMPCTAGWNCRDSNHKGYQSSDCSWNSVTYCPNGCSNGECANPTNPNALPGDDIMEWRIESLKNDGAIFQAHQSINPLHGCAQYQDGCDYNDYTWLGGELLSGGMPIQTGYSSGTNPGQEFQPEEFYPYIVGWNRVEITVFGDSPVTSDEVEFFLYEGSNKGRGTFFTKRYPYVHTWYPGKASSIGSTYENAISNEILGNMTTNETFVSDAANVAVITARGYAMSEIYTDSRKGYQIANDIYPNYMAEMDLHDLE